MTRGLDKTVPMKNSGVEWIGDSPKHWTICRIKDLATSTNGGAFKDYLVDIGLPIIKIQQLTLGSDATEF
jgi:type I restriction enzyme S subunit